VHAARQDAEYWLDEAELNNGEDREKQKVFHAAPSSMTQMCRQASSNDNWRYWQLRRGIRAWMSTAQPRSTI